MNSAIYIRTSTQDQEPENQLSDCLTISNSGDEDPKIFIDKQSAWKEEKERPEFKRLKKLIKRKSVKTLVVWDLDRIYRDRKKLIEFFEYCKLYRCKIISFRQGWLNELHNVPKPFDEIMFDLMLNIMGWLAQEESDKKSKRVKAAVRKAPGKPTKSYKGRKWGRKSISTFKKNKILGMRDKPLRTIAAEVGVSVGVVHKTLATWKGGGKGTKLNDQNLVN